MHLHIYIINMTILYVHILCIKYEEEKEKWIQCPPPQKNAHHDLIGGCDSFLEFEECICDAIHDAKEQGEDLTLKETDIS